MQCAVPIELLWSSGSRSLITENIYCHSRIFYSRALVLARKTDCSNSGLMSISCKKDIEQESKVEKNQITTSSSLQKNYSIKDCEINLESLENEHSFNGEIISNEKIAKEFSDIVIESVLNKNLDDYEIVNIAFDSNNNVWVLSYLINNETLGGGINVALSKADGKIINIWFDE